MREPTVTNQIDMIDRQAAIDALDGNVIVTSRGSAQAVMDYIRGSADRIRSLPSAQPNHNADVNKKVEQTAKTTQNVPNDNLISRKAATQAALEFIVEYLGGAFDEELQKKLMGRMKALPSAQPDHSGDVNGKVDLIDRQVAIDAVQGIGRLATLPDNDAVIRMSAVEYVLYNLPSAQPERLTDDDFETIRIHLNAYKEKLCNQQRWKEAEEYQRIIDRFMAFASAQPDLDSAYTEGYTVAESKYRKMWDEMQRQPEIIRCKECRFAQLTYDGDCKYCQYLVEEFDLTDSVYFDGNDYCSHAERRTDEGD